IVPGHLIRGDEPDFEQLPWVADDGNHRLVAAALGGATQVWAFVGKEQEEAAPDIKVIKLSKFAQAPMSKKAELLKFAGYVDEARRNLELAGLFDTNSDYDGMLGDAVMALVEAHSEQGHSGFSHYLTVDLFNKVINREPLTAKYWDEQEQHCRETWNSACEDWSIAPGYQGFVKDCIGERPVDAEEKVAMRLSMYQKAHLPPDELDALALLAKTDMSAMEQLYDELEAMIWKLTKKYDTGNDKNLEEELFAAGASGLVEAVHKYDETKGHFSTYAYDQIHSPVDHAMRRHNNERERETAFEVGEHSNLIVDDSVITKDTVLSLDEQDALKPALDQLPERSARIVRMFFGIDKYNPMTLREIGEALGVSYQRIEQIVKESLSTLAALMGGE
ncbi:MAG: sigma-70 family RNA polymerase sigma factor, partial [Deltaproteobacteria bacterium]|nr:sigma-70 family RNA polymerase sigma factor [Deltaproteobacteria bacterium]